MIPLGLYLLVRGVREYMLERAPEKTEAAARTFERTPAGGVGLGTLLVIIGWSTSSLLIGVPVMLIGLGLLSEAVMQLFRRRSR